MQFNRSITKEEVCMLKDINTNLESGHPLLSMDSLVIEEPEVNAPQMHSTTIEKNSIHLFEQFKSQFFNELVDDQTLPKETTEKIEFWLAQHSLEELHQLNGHAKKHFLYEGITFAVYGESSGIERTIPFDLIPRVIAKQQWNKVAAGCTQRIKALNLFLHDIYHGKNILNDQVIPELHVLTHDAYQPHMIKHQLNGGIYSQISGIDIVRDRTGEFYVLEDNLRTPSGVSYMLESRKMSKQLMPDLCRNHVQNIEQYPQLLREILAENAYVNNPFIVVLTPGRYNSAYYEHAFLAREMDVPLVTSRDLFVENNRVYVKTVRGRQQVDVIYRRLDDAFIDPLAFKPDSTLGVAGLMSAYLQHNVVIANAPGTGVADDKSIYPYVDKMIEYYLGEQAILKNVPTYQCRDCDDLDYVLENLESLVVKEAQGSGGYGMLIGPQATEQQVESFREKLITTPHAYIAQPTLDLSVVPTLSDCGIAERHIDLRPFILCSPYRTEIVPGGLTRVAMQQGSLVVNSSQGGGIKDTWVVDHLHV